MLFLISGTAHAAGPAPAATPPQSAGQAHEPAPAQAGATRIETDQKTGVIRFVVKGREVARIDAKGLHVRGDIDYTGVITDL
jgi:hypothetical protein